MNEATPRVTLFSVTYNQRERASETLRDALAQDYPADRLSIIFLDDGGTDGTVAALEAAAQGAAQSVTVIAGVHEQDYHHSRLFNRCIQAASPETEVFIQVDDVNLRPDFIRQHVKWHQRPTEPHAVTGAKFEGPAPTWSLSDCRRSVLAQPGGAARLDVPASAMWGASLSYTRALVDAISTSLHEQPYDERMTGYGHHEVEFAYRLARAGACLVYDPAAGVYHKDHSPMSESARGFDRDRVVAQGLQANAWYFEAKHGCEIPKW